eukprot:CAMPEP_0119359838 /NCGR_PEP_ID=MMETSP1334-20130426/7625_1 /TAXON_ID=127549 /ORGANISM="Calcidiscus leptoporus, Strain RCC1130" /LENGTH=126 /DNA_ID=CAMNT_0007374581 /DNA_START=138 /DNA_END=519 /DNA_ORIENTATION=+
MKTTTQTSLFRKQSVDSCARSVRVECARSVRVECALYAVLRCERSWYAEGQGKDKGAHAQHAHVDMRVSRGKHTTKTVSLARVGSTGQGPPEDNATPGETSARERNEGGGAQEHARYFQTTGMGQT